jgi:hypothetical protein
MSAFLSKYQTIAKTKSRDLIQVISVRIVNTLIIKLSLVFFPGRINSYENIKERIRFIKDIKLIYNTL